MMTIFPDDPSRIDVIIMPYKGLPAELAALEPSLAKAMKPANPQKIIKLLTELSFVTARKQTDHTDTMAMIAAYTQRLADIPLDALTDACKAWGNREKWFPTVAEIREEAHWRIRWRKLTWEAVRKAGGIA